MNFIIRQLLSFPAIPALALIFLLPALEASIFLGFVFPGETAVILGGVLASQHRFPVWLAALTAGVGAIAGDSVGYWVGRKYGHQLLSRIPKRLLKPESVHKTVDFIAKRGGLGVFIGRFTTALRVLVPGAAGMAEMPYRKFLLFNVLGGLSWAALYTALGYVAGVNYGSVMKDASLTSSLVLAAVVVALAGYGAYRHFGPMLRKTGQDAAD